MREIKFRAWDKERKLMREPAAIGVKGGISWVKGTDFGYDGNGASFELMQFTGLRDKDGNDIYEGDIVRQDLIDGSELGQVVYTNNARFVWVHLSEGEGHGYGFDALDWGRREVIGNVHENPELLK